MLNGSSVLTIAANCCASSAGAQEGIAANMNTTRPMTTLPKTLKGKLWLLKPLKENYGSSVIFFVAGERRRFTYCSLYSKFRRTKVVVRSQKNGGRSLLRTDAARFENA